MTRLNASKAAFEALNFFHVAFSYRLQRGPWCSYLLWMKKHSILKSPLRIYTTVWGDKHLDLFEKTIIRSFKWPLNNASLLNEDVTWSVYTIPENKVKICQLIKGLGINNIEITEFDPCSQPDIGAVLLMEFKKEILRCIETKSRLLIAPPDTMYGDGSLDGLFRSGSQPGTCISVPHPRVLPDIFEYPGELGIKGAVLKNAELVKEAFNHLHKTWAEAEVGLDKINSYVGGVAWRRFGGGIYSVQHRLPTNYLIDFLPNDLDFFNKMVVFGAIDHLWPSKLIEEQRQRVIGSSDVAFVVEITEKHQNVPPSYPYLKDEPDRFWRKAHHNAIFRQFQVIFRSSY